MKPRPFDYVRPDAVDEAVAILAEHGDDARILAGDLHMAGVQLDRVGGVGRIGSQLGVIGHTFDVAILGAVRQQAKTIAGVLNLAVAIGIMGLRAFNNVGDMLGVNLDQPEVASVEGILQELGVALKLVGLLAQP